MERNEIKQLLEKYYDGTTSLQEERILREYFSSNEVLPEFEADRQLFAYASAQSALIPANAGLEKKIADWIDQQDKEKQKIRHIRGYTFAGIAASIAIVIIGYITFFSPGPLTTTARNRTTDTYDNPQQAYAEAKRALLYVSMQLNKGTDPLSHMNKISEGMEGLSTFSTLGKSLEQLELISKYSNKIEDENEKK